MSTRRPTTQVPTPEAAKLLELQSTPTEWRDGNPILDRLPLVSGAYKRHVTNPQAFVLYSAETGAALCQVTERDGGKTLVVGAGIAVWAGGSSTLPETVMDLTGFLTLPKSGNFVVGYWLEPKGDVEAFLVDVGEDLVRTNSQGQEIGRFHILLAQIQLTGGRVATVTDLRNFSTDRQDPVANWLTAFQDGFLQEIRRKIIRFASEYMDPFTAGLAVYAELGLSSEEIDQYELRNVVPSRLSATQRSKLSEVKGTLDWAGQLLGFNDASLLNLNSSVYEKRLLSAGTYGLYGRGKKKRIPHNPVKYDLSFVVGLVPSADKPGTQKTVLKTRAENGLEYPNPVVLYVDGVYTFDKAISVAARQNNVPSSLYRLFDDNKKLQILREFDRPVDLSLRGSGVGVDPVKVLLKKGVKVDRWTGVVNYGLWGSKGGFLPQHYCFDSLGVYGFDEEEGLDFAPRTYEITPKELVESVGLRANQHTDKNAEIFKFRINNAKGEAVLPTTGATESGQSETIALVETCDKPLRRHESPESYVKNVRISQKGSSSKIEKFVVNYEFAKKQSLLYKPSIDWLLPSTVDGGVYKDRENKPGVDIDEGDVHVIYANPPDVLSFDDGFYGDQLVQPNCGRTDLLETRTIDSGTFLYDHFENYDRAVDGGLLGVLRSEKTFFNIESINESGELVVEKNHPYRTGDRVYVKFPAGVTIKEFGGSTSVSENGGTDAYAVILDTKPSHNVYITPAVVLPQSPAPPAVQVSSMPLTFTPSDWNTAQIVTVTGVKDSNTGNRNATITHTIGSLDSEYDSIDNIEDVDVTVVDTSEHGLTISKSTVFVEGDGDSETYTIKLNIEPDKPVTLTPTVGDAELATVSPDILTFTIFNWRDAQTVTVTGKGEKTNDDRSTTVTYTATSNDDNYSGKNGKVEITNGKISSIKFPPDLQENTPYYIFVEKGGGNKLKLSSTVSGARGGTDFVGGGEGNEYDNENKKIQLTSAPTLTNFGIETTSSADDGVFEFDECVVFDGGNYNYPAIYHKVADDKSPFSYRVHDNRGFLEVKGGLILSTPGNTEDKEITSITRGGNTIEARDHGYKTGDRVILIPPTEGTLPADLNEKTTYFVVYKNSNELQLATTLEDAQGGSPVVQITDDYSPVADDPAKIRSDNPLLPTEVAKLAPLNITNYSEVGEAIVGVDYRTKDPKLEIYPTSETNEYLDLYRIELERAKGVATGKRIKENSVVDIRTFTTHDPENPVCELDNGTNPDTTIPVVQDEGIYGRISIGCRPCTGSDTESSIPPKVQACPARPFVISLNAAAISGLQWRFKPNTSHPNSASKVWHLDPATVESDDQHHQFRADINQGPHDDHPYRHFVRLTPNHQRDSLHWQKAFKVCDLFSNFSHSLFPSNLETGQRPILPSLYDAPRPIIKDTPYLVYLESYLQSSIDDTVSADSRSFDTAAVVSEEGGPNVAYGNGEINEYDDYVQRIITRDRSTNEYRGRYYRIEGPEAVLSGDPQADIAAGRMTEEETPPYDRPSGTTRPQDQIQDHLRNFGICYAYFVAEMSAAEDPVFDPDNPICWETPLRADIKTAVPTAYLLQDNNPTYETIASTA